jgi:hypothetical protein
MSDPGAENESTSLGRFGESATVILHTISFDSTWHILTAFLIRLQMLPDA